MTDISKAPVESWKLDRIKPYPLNNKKHPEKHIEMLSRSIKVNGHLDPIVVDRKGVIISGHGRYEAIKRLGWDSASVRVLDVSEAEASALRIAANKTVWNEYDTDALAKELASLNNLDFDLGSLGFDDKELSMLISDVGVIDEKLLVDDMAAAVESHERDIAERADQADEEEVRLDKAFGFKTIPLRDQKHLSRFMAEIEASHGLSGAQALIAHMKEVVSGL